MHVCSACVHWYITCRLLPYFFKTSPHPDLSISLNCQCTKEYGQKFKTLLWWLIWGIYTCDSGKMLSKALSYVYPRGTNGLHVTYGQKRHDMQDTSTLAQCVKRWRNAVTNLKLNLDRANIYSYKINWITAQVWACKIKVWNLTPNIINFGEIFKYFQPPELEKYFTPLFDQLRNIIVTCVQTVFNHVNARFTYTS